MILTQTMSHAFGGRTYDTINVVLERAKGRGDRRGLSRSENSSPSSRHTAATKKEGGTPIVLTSMTEAGYDLYYHMCFQVRATWFSPHARVLPREEALSNRTLSRRLPFR